MLKELKTTNNIKILQDPEAKQTIFKYYDTSIVYFNQDRIFLNSGGYRTKTTKQNINAISDFYGLNFKLIQKNNEWYIEYNDLIYPFSDYMAIYRNIKAIRNSVNKDIDPIKL